MRDIAIQISVVHPKQPAFGVAELDTKVVSSCNKDCYLYLAQFSDEAVWRLQQVGGNTKSGLTVADVIEPLTRWKILVARRTQKCTKSN